MKPVLAYTRRDLLQQLGGGLGSIGLASLLSQDRLLGADGVPHFAPKAKRVISIFCYGGPSQIDTFDPKSDLEKYAGQAMSGVGDFTVSQGNPGGLMRGG